MVNHATSGPISRRLSPFQTDDHESVGGLRVLHRLRAVQTGHANRLRRRASGSPGVGAARRPLLGSHGRAVGVRQSRTAERAAGTSLQYALRLIRLCDDPSVRDSPGTGPGTARRRLSPLGRGFTADCAASPNSSLLTSSRESQARPFVAAHHRHDYEFSVLRYGVQLDERILSGHTLSAGCHVVIRERMDRHQPTTPYASPGTTRIHVRRLIDSLRAPSYNAKINRLG